MNPLLCERCGCDLESDDAISIIEGICCNCRRASAKAPAGRAASGIPRTPPPAAPPRPRPVPHAGKPAQMRQLINPPRPTIVTPSSLVEPGVGPQRTRTRRRDLLIGVGFGMILTVGATALMMLKKSDPLRLQTAETSAPLPVRVAVKPVWAEVTLDDQPIGPADDKGILNFTIPSDGENLHWLNVTADGYHATRRPLTVYGGVGDLTIELTRMPIAVTLRSDPPDAQVWIDNHLKGSTPLELTLLPWEKSKITLKRAGYAECTREISPPPRGSTLELDFPLIPAGVMVRVESDPPGAIIAVDGRVAGAAPLDVPVAEDRRGKKLSITATLAGYAQATREFAIPTNSGTEPITALLTLTRPHSEMTIVSNPPGAEIRIDGRPLGRAPVVASFTQEEIGARIEIEGEIAGSHIGKLMTRVPPAGENQKVTLALSPSGKRVAYIVLSPTGTGTDHVLLMDHLVEQIHRLDGSQQFGIIACTVDGLRRWPEDGTWATATSENKIRGYDIARAIRPAARGPLDDTLTAIRELSPEIIWLFAAGEVSRESLDLIADASDGAQAGINVVKIGSPEEDNWLGEWAGMHDGIVSFIGPATGRAVARDSTAID